MPNPQVPAGDVPPSGGDVLSLRSDFDPRLAVVVGSGPSLGEFDLRNLDRPWVFPIAINNEYLNAEGKYKAGAWIFNDWPYYAKLAERGFAPYDDAQIVVSREIVNAIRAGHCHWHGPIMDRALTYEARSRTWDADRGIFLARKTTATAALCLAHLMGFRSVALLGVDLYFQDGRYYHSDDKAASRRRDRSMVPVSEGRYQDDWLLGMMDDMVRWKTLRDRSMRPMEVIQCSVKSPLTCFPVMTWGQAVDRHASAEART